MCALPLMTRYATGGMISTVDYLASEAGIGMLEAGGSAADAAVCASAVLAVTTPHMCGMGGDLFALVKDSRAPGDGRPFALNASGRAGSGADAARLRDEGNTLMPFSGDLRSAPVPGCVDGWLELHASHGRLALAEVLAPAIGYAEDGFPASPLLAGTVRVLEGVKGAEDLNPTNPRSGRILRRPGVGRALRSILSDGRDGFYLGEFGQGLIEIGRGEYTEADLARQLADWVEPLVTRVFGHDLWTVPPNSQGYLTLLGCAIAEGLELPDDPADPLWAHLLVESARAAAYDRPARLYEGADVTGLLGPEEVGRRRSLIGPGQRSRLGVAAGSGDTMFLCAVDSDGNGVSLIQSNASGFGSHVFEQGTGIGLHNRGIGFSLASGHPAEYGPGRRPPHTLAPLVVTRPDGSLRAVLGTMGGDAQPQILLQILVRWLHHGQDPGRSIGSGRFTLSGSARSGFDTWTDPDGVTVEVEEDGPARWPDGLRSLGHEVNLVRGVSGSFGHAHMIEVAPDTDPISETGESAKRVLGGACDPRTLVGSVAAF
jgi:gamma-glutamyltranspeptidase / glutathione hydrolase